MSLTLDPDDVIKLWTRNGECEIQLLSGDITKLPVSEKVDIIMVSAFPGDYTPMKTTVIGALHHNLNISTDKLSHNKELDLRKHFSCWLSRKITDPNSPYGRLLCFERRRGSLTMAQQIADMFRVFVPVFNNQDKTVITPLLATGHQGASLPGMCGAMVDAAAHWINAGLPLRCLKLVIYEGISDAVQNMFYALKRKLMAKNKKMRSMVYTKSYDVYISFTPSDQQWVSHIKDSLSEKKSDVKVYAKHQTFDTGAVWQDAIFKIMVASKKIVTVLSPAFLEDSTCLEQYNMAVCCNRMLGMEVLFPFYVETVLSLPTYMTLVQWVDCRVRRDGDKTEEKLAVACRKMIDMDDVVPTTESDPTSGSAPAPGLTEIDKFQYDVFVSYSHKTPIQAEFLLLMFRNLDSNLKVFYDRSALTAGSNWQNMLYQCLGNARCVIALVGPSYMASTICMEEYHIAQARFLSQDDDMQFIPVCVEEVDVIPATFTKTPLIDGRGDFHIVAKMVAKAATDKLNNKEQIRHSDVINTVEEKLDNEELLSELRSTAVREQYKVSFKDGLLRTPALQIPHKDDVVTILDPEHITDFDIAISYANDAMHLAATFCYLIDKLYPGLTISVLTHGDQVRLKALDSARKVVIFLSQDFLKTDHFMNELHVSLCRQRPDLQKVLYLIKAQRLLPKPYFPHLLHYDVSCTDKVWYELEKKYVKGNRFVSDKKVVSTSRMEFAGSFSCDFAEYFSIQKAVEDVLESILKEKDERTTLKPNLLNIVEVEMMLNNEKKQHIAKRFPLKNYMKEVNKSTKLLTSQKLLKRFSETAAPEPHTHPMAKRYSAPIREEGVDVYSAAPSHQSGDTQTMEHISERDEDSSPSNRAESPMIANDRPKSEIPSSRTEKNAAPPRPSKSSQDMKKTSRSCAIL